MTLEPQPNVCRLFIRPKRANNSLSISWEKWVIPLPLPLKCDLMRIARENRVSQAELGLIIVRAAFEQTTWLAAVLRAAAGLPALSGPVSIPMDGEANNQKAKIWSAGKKLVRFHIDAELYWLAQQAAAQQKKTITSFLNEAVAQRCGEHAAELIAAMKRSA